MQSQFTRHLYTELGDSDELDLNKSEYQDSNCSKQYTNNDSGLSESESQESRGLDIPYLASPQKCNSLPFSQEQNMYFFTEFARIRAANTALINQVKVKMVQHKYLQLKEKHVERQYNKLIGNDSNKKVKELKKRFRRTATQIARHYRCISEECEKSYGSEGSLNQHIKLKHPELYNEYMKMHYGTAQTEKSKDQKNNNTSRVLKEINISECNNIKVEHAVSFEEENKFHQKFKSKYKSNIENEFCQQKINFQLFKYQ